MDDDAGPLSPARLVLDHWRWACNLARRKARLIYQLDPEEAAGEATLALVGAAQRYRPSTRGWVPPERVSRDVSEMADALSAPQGPTAEDLTLLAEMYRMIRQLPAPFCNVLERQYFRGETQEAIGASMGVTASRICQLARTGVAMLALAARDKAT